MDKFILFVSLSNEFHIDVISSYLFSLGYPVAPINNDYIMSDDNSPVSLLGLSIVNFKNESPTQFRKTLKSFLDEVNIHHYGMFVFNKKSISWNTSNIKLSEIKEIQKPKRQRKEVPYLKLVPKV